MDSFSTRWSLVGRAGGIEPGVRREALSSLLAIYEPMLRAHLRIRWRLESHDIDEVFQEFVTEKILEQQLVLRANPARGRFRTLLLSALDNHLRDRWRREQRRPKAAELHDEPPIEEHQGDALDHVWAWNVVLHACAELKRECLDSGRENAWRVFSLRLATPLLTGAEPTGYAEVLVLCGFACEAEARNALASVKRTFHRILRYSLHRQVPDEDVDAELGELQRLLALASVTRLPPELLPAMGEVLDRPRESPELASAEIHSQEWSALVQPAPLDEAARGLAKRWRELLATPAPRYCGLDAGGSPQVALDVPLRELLHHTGVDLAALRAVKRVARSRARPQAAGDGMRDSVQLALARVLYHATLAAAWCHCGTSISKRPLADLRLGWSQVADLEWLDDSTRELFEQAMRQRP